MKTKQQKKIERDLSSVKRNVFYIGQEDQGEVRPVATGFFASMLDLTFLVTAKHVAFDESGNERANLVALLGHNGEDEVNGLTISEIKNKYKAEWWLHSEDEVDIALLPFVPVDPDNFGFSEADIISLDEIHELREVFSASYQPGLVDTSNLDPIIRTSTVSRIDGHKAIIDGFAFDGNSGSPVFLNPASVGLEGGSKSDEDGSLGVKLIGVLSGNHQDFQNVRSSQSEDNQLWFQQNTGLTWIYSAELISEIVTRPEYYDRIKHLYEIREDRLQDEQMENGTS